MSQTSKRKQNIRAGKITAILAGILLLCLAILPSLGLDSIPSWKEIFNQTNLGEKAPVSGEPLTVHYIDVGQGDSEFIELPNGQTMLIDTGTKGGVESVIKYIEALGYDKIDFVVFTHYHDDHMGGAAKLLKAFDVEKIYLPKMSEEDTPTTKYYTEFLEVAVEQGKTLSRGKSGVSIIKKDGLNIELFAPVSDSYSNLNNYSIGLKLTYYQNSFLFFGDGEALAEKEVLKSGFDISADVYKVSHHGSNTSSSEEFLDEMQPKYAVISCGEDNSYGHPDSEILHALQERNVEIHRTDLEGSVTFACDGTNYTVITED